MDDARPDRGPTRRGSRAGDARSAASGLRNARRIAFNLNTTTRLRLCASSATLALATFLLPPGRSSVHHRHLACCPALRDCGIDRSTSQSGAGLACRRAGVGMTARSGLRPGGPEAIRDRGGRGVCRAEEGGAARRDRRQHRLPRVRARELGHRRRPVSRWRMHRNLTRGDQLG